MGLDDDRGCVFHPFGVRSEQIFFEALDVHLDDEDLYNFSVSSRTSSGMVNTVISPLSLRLVCIAQAWLNGFDDETRPGSEPIAPSMILMFLKLFVKLFVKLF